MRDTDLEQLTFFLGHEEWDAEVAALLMTGLDPDHTNSDLVNGGFLRAKLLTGPFIDPADLEAWLGQDGGELLHEKQHRLAKLREKYNAIRLLQRRAGKDDHRIRLSPARWLAWARDRFIVVPWLVDAVEAGFSITDEAISRRIDASPNENAFPYLTDNLRLARWAATEFWAKYDKSRVPKNETIVQALMERGKVSRNVALSIAAVIRPDDAPSKSQSLDP